MERRLSTILAADVVGYSKLMGNAETETAKKLSELNERLRDHVHRAGGRVFSRAGDGFLCEFQSPVAAIQVGYQLQNDLQACAEAAQDALHLRIGVHLADVLVDGEDLIGDGVNIAARIEALAEPGSVFLSQPVFDQVKRTARLKFEDLGERELKNISDPMRLFKVLGDLGSHSYISGDPERSSASVQAPVNPNSIAVLPFANFSSDPDQEYFSDGFSEDLITELARFRDLFVVSRNASFAYKGRNVDIREIGKQLGVHYCLEGSVRKMGARVRVTAQLIDTSSGEHVWADKFDYALEELFDLQDDLAATIVSTVAGKMEHKSRSIAQSKKPNDMQAYDCLLHGLEYHRLGGATREAAEQAVKWFELAIEKDPGYGRAYAWRACSIASLAEWTGEDVWDVAVESGLRGIELDENDAECHRIAGSIALYSRDYKKAEYHFSKAIELNPNHAYIVGRMGELYTFLGEGEKALEYQRRAVELDPLLPAYCRELEVVAYYILGQYQETLSVFSELVRPTRRATAYTVAAASHLSEEEPLQKLRDSHLKLDPKFSATAFTDLELYKEDKFRQQLKDDLLKAGLPE